MDIKEIKIDGQIVAKYKIDKDSLFLNINKKIFKNAQISILENVCTTLISHVEKKELKTMA